MNQPDEPLFDSQDRALCVQDGLIEIKVRDLARRQPYAVLCTQGHEQPYGALIALAFSQDLKFAVFATPVTTRKYRLLSGCENVALVVDNRSEGASDMMSMEAVTVTGRAIEVSRADGDELGDGYARWSELLIERHPHLSSFVQARSCALFRIDVVRYFHVTRFQEVYQWSPHQIMSPS